MNAPSHPDAAVVTALQAALRHHQSGELDKAEALYRHALALAPSSPDALHLLGVACAQQGRHDEAVDFIGRAVAQVPHLAAMHLNLGNALLGARRHESAIESYREALRLEPSKRLRTATSAARSMPSTVTRKRRHAIDPRST